VFIDEFGTIVNAGVGNTGTYAGVEISGNSGGTTVLLQNDLIQSGGNVTNAYGILTDNNQGINSIFVQNNNFGYMEQPIKIESAYVTTVIQGNSSFSTNGSTAVAISGTNKVQYGGNSWDKPPIASVTSCGSGPTVSGNLSGSITVGTGTSVESCTLTLPWTLWSPTGSGGCIFTPSVNTVLYATSSQTAWTITSTSPIGGDIIYYQCSGQQ
jgi:hypothetical protein